MTFDKVKAHILLKYATGKPFTVQNFEPLFMDASERTETRLLLRKWYRQGLLAGDRMVRPKGSLKPVKEYRIINRESIEQLENARQRVTRQKPVDTAKVLHGGCYELTEALNAITKKRLNHGRAINP